MLWARISLDLSPDVRAKVTVIPKGYAAIRVPNMHQHTIFGIPTSNNIGDMLWTRCEQFNI